MKIRQTNQLGLNLTNAMRDFIKSDRAKARQFAEDSIALKAEKEINDIVSDSNNINYIFTNTAISISKKIKIDKFSPELLSTSKEYKATFLLGSNKFYRVNVCSDSILVMYCTLTPEGYFEYHTFRINPNDDTISFPDNGGDYMGTEYFRDFLQLLIFFQYSETIEIVLEPNRKVGTKREGRFLNDSPSNVTLVDSTWNTIIIRNGQFTVSGHFRLQRYGEGKKQLKLIYIDEFVKSGYVRGAKRDEFNLN